MVEKFESSNMAVLYPNQCYNEVCYKGTALLALIIFQRS